MALTLKEIETEYFAGNRALEDLFVIDAQGYEWAITHDEYDALYITNEDESLLLDDVETFYSAPYYGAMHSHGPFTFKD